MFKQNHFNYVAINEAAKTGISGLIRKSEKVGIPEFNTQ